MADDWIPMRYNLRRDPKTIHIADALAKAPAFAAWFGAGVTRNVTRYIVVTALLEVWGMGRERGERIGDDLVLACCSLDALNEICEVPGFGQAMASAKWARPDGEGSMVFPNWFKPNERPELRHKNTNAERQSRYRERKRLQAEAEANAGVTGNVTRNGDSNVTGNVTVAPYRTEEKSNTETPLPPETGGKGAKPRKGRHATRSDPPAAGKTPEPWWPLFEAVCEITACNRKQSGASVAKMARLMHEEAIDPATLRTELERVRLRYVPFRKTLDLNTVRDIWPWIKTPPPDDGKGHGTAPPRHGGGHRVDPPTGKYPEPGRVPAAETPGGVRPEGAAKPPA